MSFQVGSKFNKLKLSPGHEDGGKAVQSVSHHDSPWFLDFEASKQMVRGETTKYHENVRVEPKLTALKKHVS